MRLHETVFKVLKLCFIVLRLYFIVIRLYFMRLSHETEFSSRMHYPAFGYDALLPTLAYVNIKTRYGPKFLPPNLISGLCLLQNLGLVGLRN